MTEPPVFCSHGCVVTGEYEIMRCDICKALLIYKLLDVEDSGTKKLKFVGKFVEG